MLRRVPQNIVLNPKIISEPHGIFFSMNIKLFFVFFSFFTRIYHTSSARFYGRNVRTSASSTAHTQVVNFETEDDSVLLIGRFSVGA